MVDEPLAALVDDAMERNCARGPLSEPRRPYLEVVRLTTRSRARLLSAAAGWNLEKEALL